MKRIPLICLLLSLLFSPALWAQEEGLTVKEFYQDLKDLTAARTDITDLNGNPPAIVKMQVLTEDEVEIKASMKLDVQKKGNEYWVYMAAGAKSLKVTHPLYPQITVEFAQASNGTITKLEGKMTYRLVIDVPANGGETFEDILSSARELYNTRGEYTDPDIYRKGALLYDNAKRHTDCPPEQIAILNGEREQMAKLYQYTSAYKKFTFNAQTTRTADSVYIYLKRACNATLKMLMECPQSQAFQDLAQQALQAMKDNPNGKSEEMVTGAVTMHRTIVYGKVNSETSQSISVYAAKEEKPKPEEKKLIGNVKADGTYKVVMPDGYNYIIFDREKKAFYVDKKQLTIEHNASLK